MQRLKPTAHSPTTGLASQRLEESPGSPGLREDVGGQVSCWMRAGVGGVPAERMWLKLQVEERRDLTQGKTIRTEKKRERRREKGRGGSAQQGEGTGEGPAKGWMQTAQGWERQRQTETKRDRRRESG